MTKTITYGIMHLVVAFAVSYALTRNLAIAGSIAIIEPFIQTFAYHFHEKFWEKRKTKGSAPSSDKKSLFSQHNHNHCLIRS